MPKSNSGFTLVELSVAIIIVSILAVVVVLTMNIPDMVKQSRDTSRFSDIKTLNGVMTLYLNELPNGNTGSSSTIYISLPDKTISGNTTSTCSSLNLPAAPTGYTYQCSSPQSFRHIDGMGWVPVNFSQLSTGSPLASLPIDPANQSSTGLYYTYASIGSSYVFTALPESQKQKLALGAAPQIPNYPDVIAQGTDVTVNPLFSVTGLVGYWPMNEGGGTTANDLSGNNANGSWQGTSSYVSGKVGMYAGAFASGTDISIGNSSNWDTAQVTVSFWMSDPTFASVGAQQFFSSSNYWTNGYIAGRNTNSAGDGCSNTLGVMVYSGASQQVYCNVLSSNGWLLFDLVYDNSVQKNYLYANGIAIGSSSFAGQTIVRGSAKPLYFPAYVANFNGSIDDIRVYSRALSAAEIAALYNSEK